MDKVIYPSRFVVKQTDSIIIKGESYRVVSSDRHNLIIERDLLDGTKDVIAINKTCKIDRSFYGSADKLLEATSKYLNISIAEIKSGKRISKDVLARTVISKILEEEGVHIDVIADVLSRHRTNVYHLLKKCDNMEQFDKGLYNTYLTIKSML